MPRKYDVYIGGKALGFLEGEQNAGDRRVIGVRSTKELQALVAELNTGVVEGGVDVRGIGFDAWQAFCDDHVFVLAAGGLVVDEGSRLLAIKRLGKWDLPKGKVEKGESIEVGAVREVQEECGLIDVKLVRPIMSTWHTYERKGRQYLKRTDWFLMNASATERLTAQVEEDIEEVRWLDEAGVRMMEAETYPSLLPVLKAWHSLSP